MNETCLPHLHLILQVTGSSCAESGVRANSIVCSVLSHNAIPCVTGKRLWSSHHWTVALLMLNHHGLLFVPDLLIHLNFFLNYMVAEVALAGLVKPTFDEDT